MLSQTITIMKTEVVFNHETNNKFDALNLSKDDFTMQVMAVLLELSENEGEDAKPSVLSAAILKYMDMNSILLLATDEFLNFMEHSGLASINTDK